MHVKVKVMWHGIKKKTRNYSIKTNHTENGVTVHKVIT